jgi:hypothetical protein
MNEVIPSSVKQMGRQRNVRANGRPCCRHWYSTAEILLKIRSIDDEMMTILSRGGLDVERNTLSQGRCEFSGNVWWDADF